MNIQDYLSFFIWFRKTALQEQYSSDTLKSYNNLAKVGKHLRIGKFLNTPIERELKIRVFSIVLLSY